MDPSTLLFVAAASVVIGIAVGCTGIGGILLVPTLSFAAGIPVRAAIAIALWSYLWSGLVAVALYARRGSIRGAAPLWIGLGALPGAFLGTKATALVPAGLLSTLVAVLLMAAGLNALRPAATKAPAPRSLDEATLSALGAVCGFAGALVGAGGAVMLVPVLVALDQPVLMAIGLGQAIQLPLAAVSSITNLADGAVDVRTGSIVALALTAGIVIGVPLAHSLPQAKLRRLLAAVMVLAGVVVLLRLALSAA